MNCSLDVSLIIVSYNTADLLDNCLCSIFKQTCCEFEVIVVDNASIDESVHMIKTKYPEVTVIANENNVGFAKANNQAFEITRGRHVLVLNPDTEIIGNAIEVMSIYMDKNPDVAALGVQIMNPDGERQYSCHHFPTLWNHIINYSQLRCWFPKTTWAGMTDMTYWDYDEIREVDWISGSCMMIRTQALNQIGYLDETFFMYKEEVDWCYRAKKKGWKIVFTPEAKIIHYHGMSSISIKESKKISNNISEYYFFSQYYYFQKHYGKIYALAIRGVDLLYGLFFYAWNIPRKSEKRRIKRLNSFSIIKYSLTSRLDL